MRTRWSKAGLVGARDRGEVDLQPDQGRPVVNWASCFLSSELVQERRHGLRMTARRLSAHNPDQRPSMLQVAGSLSDVANVAVEKASRSLQDTVEVDGENAKPPRAKRRTISVLDEMGLGDLRQ